MTEKVELGDRVFDIPMLPVTQLQQIARIVDEDMPAKAADMIERGVKILTVALQFVDPSLSDENIRAMPITIDILNASVAAVMRTAGFRPGAGAAGEAKAAEAAA